MTIKKLGLYLINAFFSSFIGATIELLNTILQHKDSINWRELLGSMGKGIFIGTVALYVFIYILVRFRNKPKIGFVSSFITILTLMGALLLYDLMTIPSYNINYFRWVIAFITAETLGFVLTALWYRQVKLYNDKLETTKTSIKD